MKRRKEASTNVSSHSIKSLRLRNPLSHSLGADLERVLAPEDRDRGRHLDARLGPRQHERRVLDLERAVGRVRQRRHQLQA